MIETKTYSQKPLWVRNIKEFNTLLFLTFLFPFLILTGISCDKGDKDPNQTDKDLFCSLSPKHPHPGGFFHITCLNLDQTQKPVIEFSGKELPLLSATQHVLVSRLNDDQESNHLVIDSGSQRTELEFLFSTDPSPVYYTESEPNDSEEESQTLSLNNSQERVVVQSALLGPEDVDTYKLLLPGQLSAYQDRLIITVYTRLINSKAIGTLALKNSHNQILAQTFFGPEWNTNVTVTDIWDPGPWTLTLSSEAGEELEYTDYMLEMTYYRSEGFPEISTYFLEVTDSAGGPLFTENPFRSLECTLFQVIDINSDGMLDIICGKIYYNTGHLNFAPLNDEDHYQVNLEGKTSHWGDLDGDRDLDVLLEQDLDNQNRIFLYDPLSGYEESYVNLLSALNDQTFVQIGLSDLNGDELVDLWALPQSGLPTAFINEESLIFRETQLISTSLHSEDPNISLLNYDIDSDGDPDWVLVRENQVHIYENNFGIMTDRTGDVVPSLTGGFKQATLADINQDGLTDLYLLRAGRAPNSVLFGTGTFRKWEESSLSLLRGVTADFDLCATSGDANLDGQNDLYISSQSYNRLLMGKIDNWSEQRARYGLPKTFGIFSLLADLDNDGDPELIDSHHIFENTIRQQPYLTLVPKYKYGSTAVLGTIIEVTTADKKFRRTVGSTMGCGIDDTLSYTFGLGQNFSARVRIIWPDGQITEFDEMESHQIVEIYYPSH